MKSTEIRSSIKHLNAQIDELNRIRKQLLTINIISKLHIEYQGNQSNRFLIGNVYHTMVSEDIVEIENACKDMRTMISRGIMEIEAKIVGLGGRISSLEYQYRLEVARENDALASAKRA